MAPTGSLPIMLFEPSALLRQTVALTAISIGAGAIRQASQLTVARALLATQPFAGVVMTVDATQDDNDSALQIIESLRAGRLASSADTPVYVLVNACSESLLEKIFPLNVQRILIKPFKARVLIEALAGIAA